MSFSEGSAGLYIRCDGVPHKIITTTRDTIIGARVNEDGSIVGGEVPHLLQRDACHEVAFDLKHLADTGERRLLP